MINPAVILTRNCGHKRFRIERSQTGPYSLYYGKWSFQLHRKCPYRVSDVNLVVKGNKSIFLNSRAKTKKCIIIYKDMYIYTYLCYS